MTLISILLPTYNGARFLREQINSILGQTYSDIELLIVDDGSTDGTLESSRDAAARDPRVKLVPSQGNLGQKQRLVQLLDEAKGKLIAFSDQDDVWDPRKLEVLSDRLDGASLAYGKSLLIDSAGVPLGRTLIQGFGPEPRAGTRVAMFYRPVMSAHGLLAHRDILTSAAFQRYLPFDWLIGLEAVLAGGAVYAPEAVVHHRLHESNQCNGRNIRVDGLLRRIAPGSLLWEWQSNTVERMLLVERLEHVGHSTVVPSDVRISMARLGAACRTAWFYPGISPTLEDVKLLRLFEELMRPLAGDAEDWEELLNHVKWLARSRIHPSSLSRSAKRIMGLPNP